MNLISRLRQPESVERALAQFVPTWPAGSGTPLASFGQAFIATPVVHAVVMARMKVFSEVDFTFRDRRTKKTFGTEALRLLETPWPGGTTTELLQRLEMDTSATGNAYVRRIVGRSGAPQLQVLNPLHMDVLNDGREKTGFEWWPRGRGMTDRPVTLTLNEVAHWAPIPHPNNPFVGVSWMQAVLDEIRNDLRMTLHQSKFFSNAATVNMFVKVDGTLSDAGRALLRDELQYRYAGVENAYKTMVLDQGAELKVVGSDFHQMDFINVQKSVEGRIASAAGVPPIIVSFRAGLDAATYSNYAMAMRAMADHTIRPAWNSVAAALGQIVEIPPGAELWYDDSHVAALRQDAKDEAEIKQTNALTLEALLRSGWTPESALEAVQTGDLSGLEHTGLSSVQLVPPEPNAPALTAPSDGDEEEDG